MGLYRCVMVITCLYGYNRQRDRHKDREQREETEKMHPKCLLSGVCWLVGLLWFGSVRFGSVWFRFLCSIKKIFNFPNFFRNYLIFNAFQI